MTTSMYCLYVGFDYTYIDINALTQGIKSFLVSQVWFQAMVGARTNGTDSVTETSLYVCMYACVHICMCAYMHVKMAKAYNSLTPTHWAWVGAGTDMRT